MDGFLFLYLGGLGFCRHRDKATVSIMVPCESVVFSSLFLRSLSLMFCSVGGIQCFEFCPLIGLHLYIFLLIYVFTKYV